MGGGRGGGGRVYVMVARCGLPVTKVGSQGAMGVSTRNFTGNYQRRYSGISAQIFG